MLHTVIHEHVFLQQLALQRMPIHRYALKNGLVEVKNGLVDRVVSTDLRDYLDERLSPGMQYPSKQGKA